MQVISHVKCYECMMVMDLTDFYFPAIDSRRLFILFFKWHNKKHQLRRIEANQRWPGNEQQRMCFGNDLKELGVDMWDTTSLATSSPGLMSASLSNGQPQSWQAVNQRKYRKPLVQGYTIKSGNGLIKPATPQQTFWFCLLRAAQSLGWVKI